MDTQAKRYYCRLNKCEVDIVWDDRGFPICFGTNTWGNICDEEEDNFIELGRPARPDNEKE